MSQTHYSITPTFPAQVPQPEALPGLQCHDRDDDIQILTSTSRNRIAILTGHSYVRPVDWALLSRELPP